MDLMPIHIYEGQPGTAATLIYTCPIEGAIIAVDSVLAANTTGTAATVSLQRVPKGNTSGTQWSLVTAQSIGANSNAQIFPAGTFVVLNPGDALYALQGTASAITLNIDGEIALPGN